MLSLTITKRGIIGERSLSFKHPVITRGMTRLSEDSTVLGSMYSLGRMRPRPTVWGPAKRRACLPSGWRCRHLLTRLPFLD